jgi:hypothetical protein
MSKCIVPQKTVSEQQYKELRKNNLEQLIKSYNKLSNNLEELEASPNKSSNNSEINNLNKQIYDLQNKVFTNNKASLDNIKKQRQDIVKKSNSSKINQQIILKQNDILDVNENNINLSKVQLTHSDDKKDKLKNKTYIYWTVLFLLIGVQVGILFYLSRTSASLEVTVPNTI